MKKAPLVLSVLFTICLTKTVVFAQASGGDSCVRTWGMSASGALQVPGGDLLYRFGNNGNAGLSVWAKTKQNIVYSANWSYLFGGTIRETGFLDSIATADGHILDKEGKYADLRLFERGFNVHLSAGKIFSLPSALSPNLNSGLFISLGVGYLQHRIWIYDNGGRTPELTGAYLKGYDRMTSGLSFNEFVGYWYMGKKRFVNFYAGFDLCQGITKSRRSWDFDLMRADTEQRYDLLTGVRVGWVIPFYKRTSNTYHSY